MSIENDLGGPPPHATSGCALMEAFMENRHARVAEEHRLRMHRAIDGLRAISRGEGEPRAIAHQCLIDLGAAQDAQLMLLNSIVMKQDEALRALDAASATRPSAQSDIIGPWNEGRN
jgi:hypothetical protein